MSYENLGRLCALTDKSPTQLMDHFQIVEHVFADTAVTWEDVADSDALALLQQLTNRN